MAQITLHACEPDTYDRLDFPELHGQTSRWKEFTIDDVLVVVFPAASNDRGDE